MILYVKYGRANKEVLIAMMEALTLSDDLEPRVTSRDRSLTGPPGEGLGLMPDDRYKSSSP